MPTPTPRKGPRVKRLERIQEQFDGKPREALVAALDALERLRLNEEDCALGGLYTGMVQFLRIEGTEGTEVLCATPCQKPIPSSARCYTCSAGFMIDGTKCKRRNGKGAWGPLYDEAVRVQFRIAGRHFVWDLTARGLGLPVGETTGVLARSGEFRALSKQERLEARDLSEWVCAKFSDGSLQLSPNDRAWLAQTEHPPAPGFLLAEVVGMQYQNPDGAWRSEIAAQCRLGDLLRFEREPNSPYDPDAVKVLTPEGKQVGYLSRYAVMNEVIGWQLARRLDAGTCFSARIVAIAPRFTIQIAVLSDKGESFPSPIPLIHHSFEPIGRPIDVSIPLQSHPAVPASPEKQQMLPEAGCSALLAAAIIVSMTVIRARSVYVAVQCSDEGC